MREPEVQAPEPVAEQVLARGPARGPAASAWEPVRAPGPVQLVALVPELERVPQGAHCSPAETQAPELTVSASPDRPKPLRETSTP